MRRGFSVEALLVDPRLREDAWRKLPDWARCDMADIALNITAELRPGPFLLPGVQASFAPVHIVAGGHVFARLLRLLPDDLDTLFIVPWLIRGGADQAVINYAAACSTEFGHSVAVLSTEVRQSPWASRLPDDVLFIEGGALFESLDSLREEDVLVLARLLLQARPKRIHIINSRLAWRTVQKHGAALRNFSRTYGSLFCDERDAEGCPSGYAVDYLRDVSPRLDAVLTDNAMMPAEWIERYGLDSGLFRSVHLPVNRPIGPVGPAAVGRRSRILWASRLDRQKRPDLLLQVARALPQFQFDVHGVSLEDHHSHWYRSLDRQSNIHLHGPFEAVADLIAPEHAAFFYTSAWDGLPVVLLDAIAARIPVVAPAVGGIVDLLPVSDLIDPGADMVEAYVGRLTALAASEDVREQVLTSQVRCLDRHSWGSFVRNLALVPYYTDWVPPIEVP